MFSTVKMDKTAIDNLSSNAQLNENTTKPIRNNSLNNINKKRFANTKPIVSNK